MPVASSCQTRTTCPLTRPVPTPSTAPMTTAAIPSGAGWPTRNRPPRATLRISGSSRLCCVTGRWMIWRTKMKTTITTASTAVTITLIFIRTLLLYRRHLGGPTIHQYGVLKSSVTGARVGLHPSKGGKRGWVFLRSTISKWVGNNCKSESSRMLYDIQFPCACNGLRPALYLELAVDRVDIPLHGTHRNHQSVRNLSIGVARHNQPQHLQLAFAQRFTKRVHSR